MAAEVYGSTGSAGQSVENRPTLLVQTTYFSERDRNGAAHLGFELYDLLTRAREDRLAFGPGIPVRIAVHPEEVAVDAAKHVVVIPVLGQGSALSQERRNRCLDMLQSWHDKVGIDGAVLPVLMSKGWSQFSNDLPGQPVLQHVHEDEGGFARTILELVLATCRLLRKPNEDFRIFISHAKGDLASTEHAAQTLREFVKNDTTGAAFFDTTDLRPGVNLREQLKAASEQGVFLAVRSDGYGSRHWCQRELLWAKQAGLPTLTVEVLRNGEARSYPYGGNGPTIVWSERAQESEPVDPSARARAGSAKALCVILRAAVEWLRAQHFRCEGPRLTPGLPQPVLLIRAPELLDLAQGPLLATRSPVVLHPDPELSFAEREVLRLSRPRLQLITPTTLYRSIDVSKKDGAPRPAALFDVRVALSVSDVIDDARIRKGIRKEHAQDALVHIARVIVSAGAAIAYGGDLRQGGYDELFADLIRSYNEAGVLTSELLHSYLPATFDQNKLPEDRAFNVEAVEDSAHKLLPPPVGALSCARTALYLSEMRRIMSLECSARVLLAGQALPKKNGAEVGYSGPYPGLVEEAWHTLYPADGKPKPLYVVGGFGGGAALVAALGSDNRAVPLLQADSFSGGEYSEYRAIAAEFEADPERTKLDVPGRSFPGSSQALARDIREKLTELLESDASSLDWNGLSIAENHELFSSQDIIRSTALIVQGLFNVRARQLQNSLEIELVSGNILRTERANAIVLPVFRDVPITGAGAALDDATGGAVSAARDRGVPMIALTSPQVDANWLVLADLGPFRDKQHLPGIIEKEAKRISQLALRHDFGRISLVTFGASVLGDVEGIAERMLAGFGSLRDKTQLQWFEANTDRFERLKTYLSQRERVALSHKTIREVDSKPATPPNEDLLAIVRRTGDQVRCTLLLPNGGAASHENERSITDQQLEELNLASNERSPPLETIQQIGRKVALLLFEDGVAQQLEEAALQRRLVIQHDLASSAIPFETLRVGAVVPGLNKGLVRRLSLPAAQLATTLKRPPTTGKLRLELVADPTCNLPSAKKEADEVCRLLADEEQVEIVSPLLGANATKAAVLEALTDPHIDVFHYSGHAEFTKLGDDGSGLVCADGTLTVRELRGKVIGPRVVFFNACQSARVRNGETTTEKVARAFAEAVLRSGVEAYLGTFWPVGDEAAALFAAKVYLRLASGDELHDAVTAARSELFEKKNPDWANYLLFGAGAFKLKMVPMPNTNPPA